MVVLVLLLKTAFLLYYLQALFSLLLADGSCSRSENHWRWQTGCLSNNRKVGQKRTEENRRPGPEQRQFCYTVSAAFSFSSSFPSVSPQLSLSLASYQAGGALRKAKSCFHSSNKPSRTVSTLMSSRTVLPTSATRIRGLPPACFLFVSQVEV